MRKFLRIFFVALVLAGVYPAAAQTVRGRVLDGGSDIPEPLAGATLHWAGTTIGTSADANGEFSLALAKGYDRLVASFVGYVSDTIAVGQLREVEFVLLPGVRIDDVVVSGRSRGTRMDMQAVVTTETISFAGLTKMACCNLAESFENSASVTVGYSDAVTGAKQIRMLGLAGIYTQMLDETRPVMRGMAAPYAMGYTPGMWLESIQVSKGVTSVTGGHEAMAGQINLEHRKPTDDKPFFVNLYFDSDARGELNYYDTSKVNDELSSILLAHLSVNPIRTDHNGDGFTDSPAGHLFNISNRWLWTPSNGMQLRAGIKYLHDRRISGQTDADVRQDRTVSFENLSTPWGSEMENENINAYVKLAVPVGRFVFDEETQQAQRSNFAFIADYEYFRTDSFYGILKEYYGQQSTVYFNGMYSWHIDPRNRIVSGVTVDANRRAERLHDGQVTYREEESAGVSRMESRFDADEAEAGVFAEYNFNLRDKLSIVAGARADYSNIHGAFFTPRAHVKWDIVPRFSLRASGGLGSRTARLISDNLWAFPTNRMFSFPDSGTLDTREESLVYGGSLMWTFRLGGDGAASLSADYFHTKFLSQVIADQEFDSRYVHFYNLEGPSYSHVWQLDFNWTPFANFDVLATFRYNETAVTLRVDDGAGGYSLRTVEKPLTSRYKGLLNLQYATRFRRWVFDFTAQVNGPARIPVQDGDLDNSEWSPTYMMFYAQVTWKASAKTNVYVGCENIGNYTQPNPIAGAADPYSTDFNASLVWGPVMGRKFYVGARIDF